MYILTHILKQIINNDLPLSYIFFLYSIILYVYHPKTLNYVLIIL